jgi:hypothetical protein
MNMLGAPKYTVNICEKMGPFGGMPPVVAPEGDMGFMGKPSCPLTLLNCCYLHFVANWGVGHVFYNKRLGNPS